MQKPEWLKRDITGREQAVKTRNIIRDCNLHTVCESAHCPNKSECFDRGTATFLALGNICTRQCSFCAVDKNLVALQPPDDKEPDNIAEAASRLDLDYLVVTMVTRDDLSDGGAEHIVNIINTVREKCKPELLIEVLVSDFKGDITQIARIAAAKPDVYNHNIETVASLYPEVRPQADYTRSLNVLKAVKDIDKNMLTKSGFMVGLGETEPEVDELMNNLREAEVDILTIGQYLAPTSKHYPVKEYIHPETFKKYRNKALQKGFLDCVSGPFVRSSYRADLAKELINKEDFITINN